MFFSFLNVSAYSDGLIQCNAVVNGDRVHISGSINKAKKGTVMTLLAGNPDNCNEIVYINEQPCNADGSFAFDFSLPSDLEYGTYTYRVGTSEDLPVFIGDFTYAPDKVRKKFIDADVSVSVKGFNPVISGTVYCTSGKTINVSIKNITDNSVIANDTITSENGIFNISYKLPNLISPKTYKIFCTCADSEKSLIQMNLTLESSVVLVKLSGTVAAADDVDVDAEFKGTNTNLVDKSTNFTGSKNVSITIPNILASAVFNLKAQGYEMAPYTEEEEDRYSYCTVGIEKDNIKLYAMGNNIYDFADKTYEISYDPDKLELKSFNGVKISGNAFLGAFGNVKIMSFENGKLKFKMIGVRLPQNNGWSGIMGIAEFKVKSGSSKVEFKRLK